MHVSVRELRFHDASIALNNRLELEEKGPRGLRSSPTLFLRYRRDAIKDGWHYRFVVRLTSQLSRGAPRLTRRRLQLVLDSQGSEALLTGHHAGHGRPNEFDELVQRLFGQTLNV